MPWAWRSRRCCRKNIEARMAMASRVSTRRGLLRRNCRAALSGPPAGLKASPYMDGSLFMKRTLTLVVIVATAAIIGHAQSSQVTQVDHEKVAAALAKGGAL